MQLIIGLGNPEEKYRNNRHNVGFLALDHILKELQTISCSSSFDAKICEVHMPNKVFFVFPQTYMNNSGKAIKQILDFYKLSAKDILVLHDDVDLALGVIKFTDDSGSAGHNGVASIIDALGTQEFRRIRIGVESRENKEHLPTDAFVLQDFSKEELEMIPFESIKARVLLELKEKI